MVADDLGCTATAQPQQSHSIRTQSRPPRVVITWDGRRSGPVHAQGDPTRTQQTPRPPRPRKGIQRARNRRPARPARLVRLVRQSIFESASSMAACAACAANPGSFQYKVPAYIPDDQKQYNPGNQTSTHLLIHTVVECTSRTRGHRDSERTVTARTPGMVRRSIPSVNPLLPGSLLY